MFGKRKNDGSSAPELSGREKKKQKTAAARTIPVQSAVLSGTGTPQSQNVSAAAGPSRAVHFVDEKHLPESLDVERFAEARAFEINAMHSAMQTARESASHRAWQELPRHLRRRAASHDVRRVPLRLRDKARAEMDPMRKKALGRSLPMRSKKKQGRRTESLLKRQKDKVWLETHIWHAKRMKMENMWGYRLAVQPTEKAFRPSHRASVHGAILHDASYYGFLELKGPEFVLRATFDRCCDPQGPSPSAKRFLTGARACDTHIYKYNAYPFDLIAPVTVIWQPQGIQEDTQPTRVVKGGKPNKKSKKQDSEKKTAISTLPVRVAWTAASFALEAANDADGPDDPKYEVEIADLRERLNVFEIMGPKSSQVIKGALKPHNDTSRTEFSAFWQALGSLQTTASLPRNMVIGCTVNDPRLTFPPKNAHVHSTAPTLSPTANIFPTSALAQSNIWDEPVRDKLKKPRYKKKDIDQRRSQNDIPGTPLHPKQQDDRIPILLVQRSLENTTESTTPGSNSDSSNCSSLHGWTLIIPSGWSMPFFSSLIYTGTRVAGQRESQSQAFESGRPHYPRDYPFTEGYQAYANARGEEEKARWERKPPAKRPNHDKLLTRSPWQPDWEVVLGLKTQELLPNGRYVDTQRDPRELPLAFGGTGSRNALSIMKPWLLRGPDIHSVLDGASSMFNHAVGLHEQINKLRAKRGIDSLGTEVRPEDLWKGALVMIRLNMPGRGRPGEMAMIYRVDDDEHTQWVASIKKGLTAHVEEQTAIENRVAFPDDIIGYVTTGNFSLSLGESSAVGAIPVARLFSLREQAARMGKYPHLLVKVRDREGTVCRPAYVEVLPG